MNCLVQGKIIKCEKRTINTGKGISFNALIDQPGVFQPSRIIVKKMYTIGQEVTIDCRFVQFNGKDGKPVFTFIENDALFASEKPLGGK